MSYGSMVLVVFVLCMHAGFGQVPGGTGLQKGMHSRILNEDRAYRIFLPASYPWATNRSYPVLYVLDGETHAAHVAGSVGYLSSQGEIPELIIVAVASTVRIRDFTQTDWSSHWVGGGGAQNFRRFLSQELIPKIEKEYRTNGFRILSGHSASGQFVLYTLTSEPALFHAYVAMSPSLDWDDHLPRRSLEASFAQTDSLKAFLYFAWSDDLGDALAEDQRVMKTLETAAPKGFRWVGKGFPEETHGSIPLLAHIDALRRLYAGYRFHNDLLEKGFAFAEKHFQGVSKEVGYTIPVPEDVVNTFGYEALSAGNIQEAMVLFQRNVDQHPNSANAYDGIADAYEKAGKWDEALASSKKAVALAKKYNDPNSGYFVRHLEKVVEKRRTQSGK